MPSYLANGRRLVYNGCRLFDSPSLVLDGERASMERRAASHTEEEEMNQRRRLLNLARKGDPKAINRLFELYQVRVYSGETLSKAKKLPTLPVVHQKPVKKMTVRKRTPARASTASSRIAARKPARKVTHR